MCAALGESAEMSGESSSRTNLEIPQAQKDCIKNGETCSVSFIWSAFSLVQENEMTANFEYLVCQRSWECHCRCLVW
jgi:hypothetical protein